MPQLISRRIFVVLALTIALPLLSQTSKSKSESKSPHTKIEAAGSEKVDLNTASKAELESLLNFMVEHHLEPVIDQILPMKEARTGFARMVAGDVFGKIVFSL